MNIRMRTTLFLAIFLGAVSVSFGQTTLRSGDPFDLRIGGVPNEEQQQINNVYTVDSAGFVNLPYINKIRAEGLTPGDLSRSIETSYRAGKIFTNPTITILMTPATRFVNVGGSVRSPMRVPFTEDMTLLTAINGAGGFNDFADQKHVRLMRGNDVTIYDVRQFRKDPSKDVKVQPGDRVEVPQTFF